ncbi:MAG TPA: glycosyltransferase family 1 protein [bacterium]|nr:glycosyltransferase family 1 protein [bacterium]
MGKKIKLAHLQVLPIMSGVQKSMFDLISRLDEEKFTVTVICQSEGELTDVLSKSQIPFIVLPSLKREINLFYDFKAFVNLIKTFRKNKFDIVHTHSSKPGFIGRVAGKISNVKCLVHTVHGFAFHEFSHKSSVFIFTLLERLAGKFSDKIIIVNDQDYRYALNKKIAKMDKLIKITNGINGNDYNRKVNFLKKRLELQVGERQQTICSVGRLWKQKDPATFIRSVPLVLKQFPDCCFLIIGDGPLQLDLEQLIKELQIEQNVKFLGWRKDVNEILQVVDIFVQTSLWEGLSLSILEAMASGKPVVATNIKGNNELILDGENGFLIKPGDHEMLADRIITLLSDRQLAERFGKRNQDRVVNEFNIENVVKKTEQVYQEIKFH